MPTPRLLFSWFLLTTLACADDLQPLGDEFGDASTLSRWERLYQVENWGHDQLEFWNIDTTTAGQMRMQPYTSSWFNNLRGVLVHKRLSGDFIANARITVGSLHNPADPTEPPNRSFSLAGIFVHRPIPSRVNPRPNPLPPGAPSWPPSGYTTDWLPGQENYIFLSFGTAGNPGTRQYEVKTTLNSSSQLYYDNRGVPNSPVIELQLVMVGQTAVVLRRHPGDNWVVENRYTLDGGFRRSIPDFDHDGDPATPPEYQIGITTYTDWENMSGQFDPFNGGNASFASQFYQNYSLLTPANGFSAQPDLTADVDYLRFARPHPALTEALLQALPVDFDNWTEPTATSPLAYLPAGGAGQYLGDNANLPLGPAPEEWRATTFGPDAALPVADWDADYDQGGLSNLFEYLLGGNATDPDDDSGLITPGNTLPLQLSFTPDQSVAAFATLSIEKSTTLAPGSWSTIATKSAGAAGWTILDADTTVDANPLTDLTTVTVANPGETKCFVRLRASIP